MRKMLIAAAGLAAAALGAPAHAWGSSGHRTVCEIAFLNLTPAAKAEVTRLLHAHPVIPVADARNTEFGWACTYPDRTVPGGPTRRDPEHFVNYLRSLGAVTLESGCGGDDECVDTAIIADFARLKSSFLPDRQRAVALIYLGHWLGDIHQPLHNSFADDRGGGQVKTTGLCTAGLHSTWDTCILQRGAYADAAEPSVAQTAQVAAAWSAKVTDSERAQWLGTAPWQWSQESYAIAIRPDVQYCIMVQAICRYDTQRDTFDGGIQRTVNIDDGYAAMAMPLIERRITQAGIRLAHILNLALDPAYRFGG